MELGRRTWNPDDTCCRCLQVFTDAVMRAAEMSHVSYELFGSLVFYATKLDALWHLFKALYHVRGWRIKMIMVWVLISTVYLAAFPSLMDVVSGYESSQTSGLTLPNSTKIEMDSFPNSFLDGGESNNEFYNWTCSGYLSEQPGLSWYDAVLDNSWDEYQYHNGIFWMARFSTL